jgi:hypothetical protein
MCKFKPTDEERKIIVSNIMKRKIPSRKVVKYILNEMNLGDQDYDIWFDIRDALKYYFSQYGSVADMTKLLGIYPELMELF